MKKQLPWIGFILMILWMLVIFLFSSKSGAEIDSNKSFLVDWMLHIFHGSKFNEYPIELQNQITSEYSFYISKTAHFIEYGILCFFAFLTFIRLKKYNIRYIISIILCSVYAITDEIHQMFSSGRTPRFLDVCIDTSGALVMVLIIELYLTIRHILRMGKHD